MRAVGQGTVAGALGWALSHRRQLLIGYLVLLHLLVYYLLMTRSSSAQSAATAGESSG